MLNIHHTVTTTSGELKRIRFLHVCFSDTNDILAAVDSRYVTERLYYSDGKHTYIPRESFAD